MCLTCPVDMETHVKSDLGWGISCLANLVWSWKWFKLQNYLDYTSGLRVSFHFCYNYTLWKFSSLIVWLPQNSTSTIWSCSCSNSFTLMIFECNLYFIFLKEPMWPLIVEIVSLKWPQIIETVLLRWRQIVETVSLHDLRL